MPCEAEGITIEHKLYRHKSYKGVFIKGMTMKCYKKLPNVIKFIMRVFKLHVSKCE